MVASIRYWLRVFGICERDEPTPLGDYLFSDVNGKDKYIEDLATLWLLHFNLIFNQHASLYHMVSNRGTDIRTQTYVLPEKDKRRAKELEDQINVLLSGDTNIDICTLLAILNKKLNK